MQDKDGVSALLLLCELAAEPKAAGRTLIDLLDDIAARARPARHRPALGPGHRPVADRGRDGPAARHPADRRSADSPCEPVDDLSLGSADLPPTDGLRYRLAEGARVIVRPSGTEPKLKAYLEVVVPVHPEDGVDAARIAAAGRLDALKRRRQGRRSASDAVSASATIETTNPSAVTARPAISGQAQRRRTPAARLVREPARRRARRRPGAGSGPST